MKRRPATASEVSKGRARALFLLFLVRLADFDGAFSAVVDLLAWPSPSPAPSRRPFPSRQRGSKDGTGRRLESYGGASGRGKDKVSCFAALLFHCVSPGREG